MVLFLGSLATLVSVFMTTRLLLARGVTKWKEERTLRQSDVLRPLSADWRRTLLALTGHVLARFNSLPVVINYRAQLRQDNIAAADPWDMSEDEILAMAGLSCVGVGLVALVSIFLMSRAFGLFYGLGLGVI